MVASFSTHIIFLTVMVTVMMVVQVAVSQGPSDPRCKNHKCNLNNPPALGFTLDPSTLGPGAPYPRCLVGPEWEAALKDLGLGNVERTLVPNVNFANWLSGEVVQNIFRMLAEETMGFTVEPFTGDVGGYDVLCCSQHHMHIESWPSDDFPDDTGYNTLVHLPIGYEGGSALFVSQHTLDTYPLATAYNAYKHLPEYSNIFPKGYSTPCTEAIKDKSVGCQEGNYVCGEATWTNTSCSPQGRYIPPQCQNNPSECQEIYMATPLWDKGFFEALIKNTGLKFILVYLGIENHNKIVAREFTAKNNFIFYWFEPDPLVSRVNGEAVAFKPPTFECRSKQNQDPNLSGGDCDRGKTLLNKFARKETLEADLDFGFYFESFQISASEIKAMLSEHTAGGGTENTYNISCNWIKNNMATWKGWIRNTIPTEPPQVALPAQEKEFPYWVISIVALVVVGAFSGVGYVMQRRAKVAGAPTDKSKPFAAMFIGPKNLAELWQRTPDNVPVALEMFTDIVRKARKQTGCYECRHVGSFFLIVAVDPASLVKCADAVQKEMAGVNWSEILNAVVPAGAGTGSAKSGDAESSNPSTKNRSRRRRPQRSHSNLSGNKSAKSAMTETSLDSEAEKASRGSESSGGSSQNASKSVARKNLKMEAGAGIQYGSGRIVYDKEQHSYDYSGAVVDDAANIMDITQRGQTLVAGAASSVIEEEGTPIPGTFAEFTTRKLNGSGLKCELLQYNSNFGPIRAYEEPNEEDVVDSVMNALQECKGGITQKRITVLCVNVVQFGARATKDGRDTSNRKYKEVCEIIDSVVISNRGNVHHSVDGQFIITFNAVAPTAGHVYRAGICASQIQADLVDLEVGPVLCGFDSGLAMCGQMPYCSPLSTPQNQGKEGTNVHQAVVGTVVQNAVLLTQLCGQYAEKDPNICCLTTTKKILDLNPILHLQHVDVIKHIDTAFDAEASPSKAFVGLVAVYGPKQTDEADCDEWLYELENHTSGDPFARVNQCFEALLEGDWEKARSVLSDDNADEIKTNRGTQRAQRVVDFGSLEDYVKRSPIATFVAAAAGAKKSV